ncbi:MAG TPA: hypothetical protein VE035_03395 [Puia sp.]|nr:hypothetical protein [Puia sp.]
MSYSDLKLFTGLAIAALMAWKLTVASAMNRAADPTIQALSDNN